MLIRHFFLSSSHFIAFIFFHYYHYYWLSQLIIDYFITITTSLILPLLLPLRISSLYCCHCYAIALLISAIAIGHLLSLLSLSTHYVILSSGRILITATLRHTLLIMPLLLSHYYWHWLLFIDIIVHIYYYDTLTLRHTLLRRHFRHYATLLLFRCHIIIY